MLSNNQSTAGEPRKSTLLVLIQTLAPKRCVTKDGRVIVNYGVFFLSLGIFLGVLATGYAPILIQMYASANFGFRSTENGYIMSVNSLIRGFFLMVLFPRLINWGRTHFASQSTKTNETPTAPSMQNQEETPICFRQEGLQPVQGILPDQEPARPLSPVSQDAGCTFDLVFLRWSLAADGLVTAYAAFATKDWHIYATAFLLPFASGSAPAAKGVITEMCPPSQRADALQALTLIENIAMLSTLGLFGFIFATFAEHGRADLTFFCNAVSSTLMCNIEKMRCANSIICKGVAFFAVGVLCLSSFPPPESMMLSNTDKINDTLVDHNEGDNTVCISA